MRRARALARGRPRDAVGAASAARRGRAAAARRGSRSRPPRAAFRGRCARRAIALAARPESTREPPPRAATREGSRDPPRADRDDDPNYNAYVIQAAAFFLIAALGLVWTVCACYECKKFTDCCCPNPECGPCVRRVPHGLPPPADRDDDPNGRGRDT